MVNIPTHSKAFSALLRSLICIVPLWFSTLALAAEFTASVDRNPVMTGESVQLVLELSGKADGDPDIKPLSSDFDVLGRSNSFSTQIINGQINKRQTINLTLMPKRGGEIVIPALRWGALTSAPLTLKVVDHKDIAGPSGKPDVFIESSVDNLNPWQNGQVIYTLRLHTVMQLLDGALSEPKMSDVSIETLGADKRYQNVIDGRRYEIVERRWVLFPQRSGKIELPKVTFSGDVSERNSRMSLLPGGRRKIRVSGPTITLDVKPPVAGEQPWLPAWQLTMSDSWSKTEELIVGEPVTRTITMTAMGLLGSQLPELSAPGTDSLKVYPDKPMIESIANDGGMTGRRMEKIALVPTQPGTLIIPGMTLRWWDARHNRAREASLPAKTFTVIPAPVSAQNNANRAEPEIKTVETIVPDPGFWPWLTAIAASAWLLTLIVAIVLLRRKPAGTTQPHQPPSETPAARQAKRKLIAACEASDPYAAQTAAIQWAAAICQPAPLSLSAFAKSISDTALSDELLDLERSRFKSEDWQGAALKKAVERYKPEQQGSANKKSNAALPELNPG